MTDKPDGFGNWCPDCGERRDLCQCDRLMEGSLVFWLKTSYTGDYKVVAKVVKINAKTATVRVKHHYSGKYTLHNVRFENLQKRTEVYPNYE